jgi:mRNA interferase YafQ
MGRPVFTRQFERDIKRMKKRGKDLEKIKVLIEKLIAGPPLGPGYRDHGLIGSFIVRRECHLESDWLLIYKLTGEEIILERTGTHSDLFE